MKKLEVLPATYNAFEWADYIELLCLTSKDKRVSKADVVDLVRERKRDLNEGRPLEGPEADEEDMEAEIREELSIEDEETEGIDEDEIEPAMATDKWTKKVGDWFSDLEYRAGAFSEFYPFKVIKGGSVLVMSGAATKPNIARKVYIFLLIAANLRYFSKTQQTQIASSFEVLSFVALKSYLPSQSVLYMFGKHPLNIGERYSSGSLWERLTKLAKDLREDVIVQKENFKPSNNGDAGLDLVGWVPLEKPPVRRGFFLIFAQCACTPKWVSKQFETHYDTWKNYLSFTAYPARLTFIPYCFRKTSGAWYDHTKISMTVLVDRLRLIELLRGKESELRQYISDHVNDALTTADPLL